MNTALVGEPYLIISADTHAGLPTEQYRGYLESRFHGALDLYLAQQSATAHARMQLHDKEFVQNWYAEHEDQLRAGWDAHRRDEELDKDGVVGEVIFPDADAVSAATAVPFGAGIGMTGDYDPELAIAGARAHNRWLSGLCQDSPDRRRGVIVAPIVGDVDGAVGEIRRAHADGLGGGIMIPSIWGHGWPPYHDRCYDPVWSVCEELGLPVQTHAGAGPSHDLGTYLGLWATEVTWWSARPMWFLIWTGVFERFPGLRFGVQECGAWWVGNMLWQMDVAYDREHGTKKLAGFGRHMNRRPSDYFDTNCFVGASTAKRRELSDRYEIGVCNILWGNDFPHPEGSWPHTGQWLKHIFADIPVSETRLMLGLTAATTYGFDARKLAPIAQRICPAPEDLGQQEVGPPTSQGSRQIGRHWLAGPDVPVIAGATQGTGRRRAS